MEILTANFSRGNGNINMNSTNQNIRTIHANLKELFNKQDVLLVDQLSYAKSLFGADNEYIRADEKVLLVCKKVHSILKLSLATAMLKSNQTACIITYQIAAIPSNGFSLSPPSRPLATNISATNLMGSPLKDDCEIDVMDESLRAVVAPKNSWTDEEECYTGIPFSDVQ